MRRSRHLAQHRRPAFAAARIRFALRRLVRRDGVVLIATSGGADSAVLAAVATPWLAARSQSASLVHVHHGLRADADADAERVIALASRLGVAAIVIRETIDPARIRAVGVEAAAREVRHQALLRVACELSATAILIAHHEDDHVETIAMRRDDAVADSRTAGLPSCAGLRVRPMLTLSRGAVRELATTLALPFADDPMNADPRFRRAAMRARVPTTWPAGSPVRRALLREARAARRLLDREAADARALRDIALVPGFPIALRRAALQAAAEPVAVRMLRSLCRPHRHLDRGPVADRLRDALGVAQHGGAADLGAGFRARARGPYLVLARIARPEQALRYTSPVAGTPAAHPPVTVE
jgi:tRNA(Ile)-lysidine synthase